MLQYVRSFASSIKENLKSLTQWSTHYFTSKDNWYPLQEKAINFKIPERLPPAKVIAENKKTMREWTSVNGKAVRKRTVRQETTMAKSWYSARVLLLSGIKTH